MPVDTKGLGTTFNLAVGGGTIDTINGAAQFLDPPAGAPPLTLDLTFDRVRARGPLSYFWSASCPRSEDLPAPITSP